MFTVTAWSNGGAGRGLRVPPQDRDRFFRRDWRRVTITRPDGRVITPNLTCTFWTTCPEIRSAVYWATRSVMARGEPSKIHHGADRKSRFPAASVSNAVTRRRTRSKPSRRGGPGVKQPG
jgi:hypothetical protein